MSEPSRVVPVVAVGVYNLVQNLMVPASAYVPANLVATGALVALARNQGCSWDDLGLDPSHFESGFRLGVAGAGLAAALAVAASSNPTARHYLLDERAAGHGNRDVIYRTMVRFPMGTALFEEVAFRGVISGVWRRSGGSKGEAALATAVAFGLWHLIPASDALTGNPLDSRLSSRRSRAGVVVTGAVATGLASLGFSWMRERSGSLVASWMTHAAINGAVYLAGVVAWRRMAGSSDSGVGHG